MLSKMLFDKFIDCHFFIDGEEVQNVVTPTYGLKPMISLEWKRVPGDFVYSLKLSITNFYTRWLLFEFDTVKIQAGYVANNVRQSVSIEAQIFSAYRATPGPDGYTVFECLVANASVDAFERQPYNLLYYSDSADVEEVLTDSCQKVGLMCDISCLSPALLGERWDTTKYTKNFATGYSVLEYLNTHLIELAKLRGSTIHFTLFNDTAIFAEVDKDGNPYMNPLGTYKDTMRIPILNQITNATWTAGTLSIVAPFNPAIKPGGAFYCTPTVYEGGTALPNQVASEGLQRDKYDMYYVVTQNVEFSTVGSQNRMTLLAVPFSNSPLNILTAQENAENINKTADELVKTAKQLKKSAIDIKFGSITVSTADEAWKKTFAGASDSYEIKEGENISQIAVKHGFGKKFKATFKNGKQLGGAEGIDGYYLGCPLIELATYQTYRITTPPENKKYWIDVENPNLIQTGNKLMIPKITSYKDIERNTQLADILDEYAKYYDKKVGLASYARNCRYIAEIIREGTIDE